MNRVLIIRPKVAGERQMGLVDTGPRSPFDFARDLLGTEAMGPAMLEVVMKNSYSMSRTIVVLGDEEGLLKGLRPCVLTPEWRQLVGVLVVMAADRAGNFVGLTEKELLMVKLVQTVHMVYPALYIEPARKEGQ